MNSNNNEIKWDLSDITIVPVEESSISSRSECKTLNTKNMLPLMAAPMDTVVSLNNYKKFIECGIVPCLPRGVYDPRNDNKDYLFHSFGLHEIENHLDSYIHTQNNGISENIVNKFYSYKYVLIDIANGHMKKIIDLVKQIKTLFPDIVLMVGNIANPETFVNLGMAGADFVRCGIGAGNACLTSANTSVHYPMGSLISECNALKKQYKLKTKIVADGGTKTYADILSALALGADYVMIGSIFNKSIESAGFNYFLKVKISDKIAKYLWKRRLPVYKKYRGMSTKEVQISWGKSKLTTAEGITLFRKVEYSIFSWTENFEDYLRSVMSYTGSRELKDFIGNVNYVFITAMARKRFTK